jgi:Short C-terminal domain
MLANITDNYFNLALPLAGVLIVTGLLLAALAAYRRRMKADNDADGADFSIGDLRRLKAAGQMTDDEFERAKAKLIATTHARLEPKNKPPASPPPPEAKS